MKPLYIFAFGVAAATSKVFAHGGGLNADGCHNSSEVGYHCDHGETPAARVWVDELPDVNGCQYWLDGYTLDNGTYVKGHYKTCPDDTVTNNLSYGGRYKTTLPTTRQPMPEVKTSIDIPEPKLVMKTKGRVLQKDDPLVPSLVEKRTQRKANSQRRSITPIRSNATLVRPRSTFTQTKSERARPARVMHERSVTTVQTAPTEQPRTWSPPARTTTPAWWARKAPVTRPSIAPATVTPVTTKWTPPARSIRMMGSTPASLPENATVAQNSLGWTCNDGYVKRFRLGQGFGCTVQL